MSRAVKCPVCDGEGKILMSDVSSTAGGWEKVCHGCGGRGWIEIGD